MALLAIGGLVTVVLDGENPWEYYPEGDEGWLKVVVRERGADGGIAVSTRPV